MTDFRVKNENVQPMFIPCACPHCKKELALGLITIAITTGNITGMSCELEWTEVTQDDT
jgi:hypothetical protein